MTQRTYLVVAIIVLWSAIPPMLCAQSHTWYLHGEMLGSLARFPFSLQVEHKIYQSDSATNYFVNIGVAPNLLRNFVSVSLTASAVFGKKKGLEVCGGVLHSEQTEGPPVVSLRGFLLTVGALHRQNYDGGSVLRVGLTYIIYLHKNSNRNLDIVPALCFSYGFALD